MRRDESLATLAVVAAASGFICKDCAYEFDFGDCTS
jgi:hypothetical protein